jgi:hypothetical protein
MIMGTIITMAMVTVTATVRSIRTNKKG